MNATPLKLEEGKRYVRRDGVVTGPLMKDLNRIGCYDEFYDPADEGMSWTDDGDYHPTGIEHEFDIIAGTIEIPSSVNPATEDILEEALRLTSGDRQNQYGPPDQDFTRTAAMWSALFAHKMKEPFEARDVAMAMICLKLSRETHQRKRDNAVDGAGYFRCLHLCNEARNNPQP